MNVFDFIRSAGDPVLALIMLVLGMLGWVFVYLLVLLFGVVQKGILRQNIALRREIAILRRSLAKPPAKHR